MKKSSIFFDFIYFIFKLLCGILTKINRIINTIHSFQGGEETIIIFDTLEGMGAKKWSMLNEFDFDNEDNAKKLLNVALTRPEKKLYIVGNDLYLNQVFPAKSLMREIIDHFKQKGKVIKSTELFNNFKEENFDYWIEKINSLNKSPINKGESFSDEEFWPAFLNDLCQIKEELIIFSPFITALRVGKLHTYFAELISKDIRIFMIVKSPNQQPAKMRNDSIKAINYINSIGCAVKFRDNMHEKIALIDRKIKWVGSLNILSHSNSREYMERFVGEEAAKEIYNKLDLDDLFSNNNLVGKPCPGSDCPGNGFITIKKQHKKPNIKFYGCTNYPACRWTKNIENRDYKFGKNHKRKT